MHWPQVRNIPRWLSVLETLDNGKPIRESRDIDIPLVARHFYHHAGWAQLLEQEFPDTPLSASWPKSSRWNFHCSCWPGTRLPPAAGNGNTSC